VIEHVLVGLALLLGLAGGFLLARSRLRPRRSQAPDRVHRILLPFAGTEISRRAVDAALRLARAEQATLMPAYLAQVPKSLPLDCAIPAEAARAMAMLEAIEQRANAQGVPVDARIERGRSYRHALARLLDGESFDRVVVSATAAGASGFSGDDLVWLLEKAPAEVLILRPGPEDQRVLSVNGRAVAVHGFRPRSATRRSRCGRGAGRSTRPRRR
jgi:nucleotide-binding universal stress UspA family protein